MKKFAIVSCCLLVACISHAVENSSLQQLLEKEQRRLQRSLEFEQESLKEWQELQELAPYDFPKKVMQKNVKDNKRRIADLQAIIEENKQVMQILTEQ